MHSFLPNFCGNRTAFIVVVAAELLAFVLALATSADSSDFWHRLALNSLFIQWVALGTVALLCSLRSVLARLNAIAATLLAYTIAQAVTLLFSLLAIGIMNSDGFRFDFDISWNIFWQPFYLSRNLAISSVICLVVLRYFYIQQQWRQNVQAEARSQLQALQARIRPHFLFNSMNTIANLIREKPDQAEDTVLDLADLFRAALLRKDQVTLEEELESARRYLRIEQQRLGERLQITWSLADDLPLNIMVPALIFQPLLENAVYHGIQALTDGGTIHIEIMVKNRRLLCYINNPTAPTNSLSQGQNQNKGQGIAQDNIRRRLSLTYGEDSYLVTQQNNKNYSVELAIPLNYKPTDAGTSPSEAEH